MAFHKLFGSRMRFREKTNTCLLQVLCMGMTICFVACQPADDGDEVWDSDEKHEDGSDSSDNGDTADVDSEAAMWGECGPKELAESVPQGVFDALNRSIEPGGFLTELGWRCDVDEKSSWSKPMQYVKVNKDVADVENSEESFLEFKDEGGEFVSFLLCDGQYKWLAMVSKNDGLWSVNGVNDSYPIHERMDQLFLETLQPNCTKAEVLVDMTGLTCWLISDKKNGPLFVPVEPKDWGKDYANLGPGELTFTKDEFLEWCRGYF